MNIYKIKVDLKQINFFDILNLYEKKLQYSGTRITQKT